MAENSKIGWTDHTFNPWIGCTKVDQLCKFCYAEQYSNRYKVAEWGPMGTRHKTAVTNWQKPYTWNRRAKKLGVRYRVFCASLADIFDDHESIKPEWRTELFKIIKETPNLDWLLLTKRPENYVKFLPQDWGGTGYPNVWLGVSAGTQNGADKRIPILCDTPAAVRFVSCEPMLGRVDISKFATENLDWVIVGGESGNITQIRQLDLNYVQQLQLQCRSNNVKFYFKQLGASLAKNLKITFDENGEDFNKYPALLEWLKVREFPNPHPSLIITPELINEPNPDLTLPL